jgi:hypothetical protein
MLLKVKPVSSVRESSDYTFLSTGRFRTQHVRTPRTTEDIEKDLTPEEFQLVGSTEDSINIII